MRWGSPAPPFSLACAMQRCQELAQLQPASGERVALTDQEAVLGTRAEDTRDGPSTAYIFIPYRSRVLAKTLPSKLKSWGYVSFDLGLHPRCRTIVVEPQPNGAPFQGCPFSSSPAADSFWGGFNKDQDAGHKSRALTLLKRTHPYGSTEGTFKTLLFLLASFPTCLKRGTNQPKHHMLPFKVPIIPA